MTEPKQESKDPMTEAEEAMAELEAHALSLAARHDQLIGAATRALVRCEILQQDMGSNLIVDIADVDRICEILRDALGEVDA